MKHPIPKRFSLAGKTAVVTGGAGFLGMQYARMIVAAGGNAVIWDKADKKTLALRVRELDLVRPGHAAAFQADITDYRAPQKAARATIRRFGTIDILINNAGLNPMVGSEDARHMFAPYEKYPPDLWQKELDADVSGAQYCIQAVAPGMMAARSGVIVNIASEVSNVAVDNRIYGEGKFKSIAYIVSKTALVGLTRAWAAYLGAYGVRVNAFSPGGMPKAEVPEEFRKKYSALTMLGRMAGIGEYDAALLFLCSDASSFMTGTNMVMDGGKSSW